jgi:poly(3-hydroxybutyrate) depolymerase
MQTVTARCIAACACAAFFFTLTPAQAACSGRYMLPVFQGIDTSLNVTYGKNIALDGTLDTLQCDIYQPSGDTSQKRPLILFMHGGAFAFGTKQSDDVILRLCAEFAHRGYVTVSIDYRLGLESFFPLEAAYFERAIYRAVQDAKAAVRFFRSHADTYRIDTSLIFEGGTSAGAFTAVHHAYLDQSEVPASVDTNVLGNIEGNSGNPGYSSRIRAVINCWGAIGDTAWMTRGDVPIVNFHGLWDDVVPYDTGSIFWSYDYNILRVFGSEPIYRRAQHTGIFSDLRLFDSTGHGFSALKPQMDTTIAVTAAFLGAIINCDSGKATLRYARPAPRSSMPGWRVRTSEGTYASLGNIDCHDLAAVDCAGRVVVMDFIVLSNSKTVVPSGSHATGVYYLVDKKNRNAPATAIFLYRQ